MTKITTDSQALAYLDTPDPKMQELRAYLSARLASTSPAPDGLRRFVLMLDAKPLRGNDPDVIYAIHIGTEYEAELRLSDIRAMLSAAPQPVVEKENG